MNCDVVIIPEGYSVKIPPPREAVKPVPFKVFLTIRSIKDFDLTKFRLTVDLMASVKWTDSRLGYSNLRRDYKANRLRNIDLVWVPTLTLIDGTKGTAKGIIHSRVVFVYRVSDELPDDESIILEDYKYDGTLNFLVLEQEMSVTFACNFDLMMYPFDQQVCYLNFEIQNLNIRFGILEKEGDGVSFLGTRYLLEYYLRKEIYTSFVDHNASIAGLELWFKNQYRYYIGNVMLPSVMLVILCYVTLYFDINDFNDRIMVSLTSLLVLVTFFTDTSQKIPRTSYLKLIDVWFVCLMFEDFFVILSIVYIEYVHRKTLSGSFVRVQPADFKAEAPNPAAPSPYVKKLNRHMRTAFTCSLSLVLLVFIPIGAYNLNVNYHGMSLAEAKQEQQKVA
nr:glutamate-gated chloride channel-like [Penaeus vannamei]